MTRGTGGTEYVIRTDHLTRYFGRKAVVRDLNLCVPRGSIFGFLGRNGSGKTTTLRMLLGAARTDPRVGDGPGLRQPPAHAGRPRRIGYLAEGHPVYGGMRVEEAGRYRARFYPTWNARLFHAILEHFRVAPATRARTSARRAGGPVPRDGALRPNPNCCCWTTPRSAWTPSPAGRSWNRSSTRRARATGRILFSSHLLVGHRADGRPHRGARLQRAAVRSARSRRSAVACSSSSSASPAATHPSRRRACAGCSVRPSRAGSGFG